MMLKISGPVSRVLGKQNSLEDLSSVKVTTNSFFIIFDDIVKYLSIRYTRLKKQGRRTKPILTVG
jgi:hypothetical protein